MKRALLLVPLAILALIGRGWTNRRTRRRLAEAEL